MPYELVRLLNSDHPYRYDGTIFGGTKLWTPSQITTALWLDADSPSSITLNGTRVSQWNDLSGNGKHATQGTTVNQPTYSVSGLRTIRFNGATGTQARLDIPAFDFGTSERSAFFVINNTGPSSGAGSVPVWFWPRAGNATNSLSIYDWVATAVQGTAGMINTTEAKNTLLMSSYVFGRTSAEELLFANGSQTGAATKTALGPTYANATSGYSLGAIPADPNSQYFFDGNMAEIILFNVALSVANQQRIEGYLAWKWGLQASLPVSHPYYSAPPLA